MNTFKLRLTLSVMIVILKSSFFFEDLISELLHDDDALKESGSIKSYSTSNDVMQPAVVLHKSSIYCIVTVGST